MDCAGILFEVVLSLVSLVFQLPGVCWGPIQHFESFAGDMAVTAAELMAAFWFMVRVAWFVSFENA